MVKVKPCKQGSAERGYSYWLNAIWISLIDGVSAKVIIRFYIFLLLTKGRFYRENIIPGYHGNETFENESIVFGILRFRVLGACTHSCHHMHTCSSSESPHLGNFLSSRNYWSSFLISMLDGLDLKCLRQSCYSWKYGLRYQLLQNKWLLHRGLQCAS